MMHLSQLILNGRSRQARRDLANPYQLHRTVMSAFPAKLPEDERVLFRLEIHPRHKAPVLLVQSLRRPEWSELPAGYLLPLQSSGWPVENPAVKQVELHFLPGQTLAFRLRANPTVKRQGKRYGLFKEDEQQAWMRRKSAEAGCELLSLQVGSDSRLKGWQPQEDGSVRRLEFYAVTFEGNLRVLCPDDLLAAIQSGIGSGKGLGFGLLSLAPG